MSRSPRKKRTPEAEGPTESFFRRNGRYVALTAACVTAAVMYWTFVPEARAAPAEEVPNVVDETLIESVEATPDTEPGFWDSMIQKFTARTTDDEDILERIEEVAKREAGATAREAEQDQVDMQLAEQREQQTADALALYTAVMSLDTCLVQARKDMAEDLAHLMPSEIFKDEEPAPDEEPTNDGT